MRSSPGCGVEKKSPGPCWTGANGLPFSRHIADLANRAKTPAETVAQQKAPGCCDQGLRGACRDAAGVGAALELSRACRSQGFNELLFWRKNSAPGARS